MENKYLLCGMINFSSGEVSEIPQEMIDAQIKRAQKSLDDTGEAFPFTPGVTLYKIPGNEKWIEKRGPFDV